MQVWLPFALRVAADDGQTVSVGVRGNDEVGIQACAQLHAQRHGFSVLRVGADDGGEVAVDDHLLRNDVNVLESP